ncbi:hypothetical protein KP509_36G030100 [Ceratopteris richardii]|uniref:Core Histone H2A/H2B/H3 domain-containing protein n=1 Tax=Ceratopteris richardii TaxID=49495 RepID=A0A8T2QBQ9_CERRI|nr:hypothetical protein KP509_36G030100 [Ceratopteris richardii]
MAKTKKIARKLYTTKEQNHGGPTLESQGNEVQTTNVQNQGDPKKAFTKKSVNYHVKSLREITRAKKSMGLLIPRLPFMRFVKEIFTKLYSMMRTTSFMNVKWKTQALLCLQEAANDFAIDFINDAYLCVAHCHRVTLMAKNYVVVSRLKYKFEKNIEPLDIND